MSIFGPHPRYTPLLQQAIDEAERFAGQLSKLDGSSLDASARAWLTGRAEELEVVIGGAVADFLEGRLSERAAVRAVASYLRTMQSGAEEHLGGDRRPGPGVGEVAVTAPMTPFEAAVTEPFSSDGDGDGEDPALASTEPSLEEPGEENRPWWAR